MTEQQLDAMKQALEALECNRRSHYYCEDTWYSCPKHEEGCANEAEGDECNCGADEANKTINAAITALRIAIEKLETAEFHSAEYWKGHDDAVCGVAKRWEEALTDKIPKAGVMNEPLESLYRRTEALRTAIHATELREQADAAHGQEPVKPYAYEYGRDNGDGTYSVVIDKGSLVQTQPAVYNYVRPQNAHKNWPIKELFDHPPAAQPAPVQAPVLDHSCKDNYELIMKWADIYAAQTGNIYSEAARDPSKSARMADERTMLACVVAQALAAQPAQRQWVGLTDEEIDQGLLRSDYALKNAHAWRAGVVFAMTKLKEKNHHG